MISVSFIIPTYNRYDSLIDLLGSFVRLELHDFDVEIIIVNDGSSDKQYDTLTRPFNLNSLISFSYYTVPNGGPGAARNYGAQMAKGNWLVFMDDDCSLIPTYLLGFRQYLSDYPNVLVACGNIIGFKRTILSNYIDWTGLMQSPNDGCGGKMYFLTANAIIEKSLFTRIGGFDMSFKKASGEDVYLSQTIRNAGIQIKFFKNCIVYHKHRDTLFGIIKTCSIYGDGHYLIEKLSGHACKRSYFKLLKNECFVSFKKIAFSRSFKYGFIYFFLDLIKVCAWTSGYNKALDIDQQRKGILK